MGPVRTLQASDADAVAGAEAELRAGGIVVVPTDTVYGLAALPDRPDAVRRIFVAKDRPPGQHLPVLAATMEQVRALGVAVPDAAMVLAAHWWPGPLTMVFGFSDGTPRPQWLEGRDEVAVRIPRHPFLLALMAATGVLLVTSANEHGSATPPSADEVARTMAPHARCVVDGGVLDSSPSTLVNLRGGTAVVEREGAIATDDIAALLAEVTGAP